MPGDSEQNAPAPATEGGTLLWNLQTQRGEYVPVGEVETRIKSGAYRTYSGTQLNVAGPGGVESAVTPDTAATRVAAGHQLISPAFAQAEARARAQREAYDTTGNAALAAADGIVGTLSGGIVEGLPVLTEADKEARRLRGEVNPGWKTFGQVAALGLTILAPSSLLGKTPLGLANRVAGDVAAGLKGAGGVIRTGVAEAAGGGVAAGMLAAGQQVSNLAQGRPASGHAVVDEVGLGMFLGGGLGVIGGALAKSAGGIRAARSEISAAGRFDEAVRPIQESLADASRSWEQAHTDATRRLGSVDDLTKSGALEGQLPSEEWLAVRREAAQAADKAKTAFLKAAKAKTIPEATAKVSEVLSSKRVKDLDLLSAYGDYGTAVSKFDVAMRPTDVDRAHLFDVSGRVELDESIPADEHGLQQVERDLAAEGQNQPKSDAESTRAKTGAQKKQSPQAIPVMITQDMRAKLRALDYTDAEIAEMRPVDAWDAMQRPLRTNAGQRPRVRDSGPLDRVQTRGEVLQDALTGTEGAEPGLPRSDNLFQDILAERKAKVAEADAGEIAPVAPTTKPMRSVELAEETTPAIGKQPRRAEEVSPELDVRGMKGPKTVKPSGEPIPVEGFSRPGEMFRPDEAAFRAHQVLNEASYAPYPVQVTSLGEKVQAALDQLQAASGNKLGAEELKVFAREMGVKPEKFADPFTSKLVDVWALRRLADGLAEAKSGRGFAGKALRSGVSSMANRAAYPMGGFASGVTRSVVNDAVGHVLGAAGGIVAAAGRLRQSAILGLSRVLSPVGRRALTLGGVTRVISEGYGGEPTSDWATKAERLRNLAANPDEVRKQALRAAGDLHGMDPITAGASADVAVTRVQNLARALPTGESVQGPVGLFHKGPPSEASVDNWHRYEAVTADRSLVFNYVRSGFVPPVVVDAMNEQHPEYMREIRDYVLHHPDEIEKAPHATKMGLSYLLGVSLVPEADPGYVARHQEIHAKAKAEAEQKRQTQQGAAAIQSGLAPLPGQMATQLIPMMGQPRI